MSERLSRLQNLLRIVRGGFALLSQPAQQPGSLGGEKSAVEDSPPGIDPAGSPDLTPPVEVPDEITSKEDLNRALRIIGWIDNQTAPAEASLKDAIAELKAAVADHLQVGGTSLRDLKEELQHKAQAYVLAKRAELFKGKTKTAQLTAGEISTRTSPGVIVGDVAAAMNRIDEEGSLTQLLQETLAGLDLVPYVKLKLEFNSSGVIAAIKAKQIPASALDRFGLRFDTPETVQLKPLSG